MKTTLPLLLLAALTLAACTQRIERQQATEAAARAATLYPVELAQRAPKLTAQTLQKALAAELEDLQPSTHKPALQAQWLSAQNPRLVTAKGPKEEAIAPLRDLCKELPLHGMDISAYACDQLHTRLQDIQAGQEELQAKLQSLDLAPEQVELIATRLTGMEADKVAGPEGDITDAMLIAMMFGQEQAPSLAQIDIDLARLRGLVQRQARQLAQLEIEGHQLLTRYAWDLRAKHAAQAWTTQETYRVWMDELADREEKRTKDNQDRLRVRVPADWPKSAQDAMDLTLRKDMARLADTEIKTWIVSLRPQGDQYARLLRAHARYQQIVLDGGFTEVKADRRLKPGKSSKVVPALRARLAQEGYLPGKGDPDKPERMDEDLTKALKAFQEAHQLKTNARLNKETSQALALTADDKLTRIKLALQKWRQVPTWGDKQLFINIPDYHGEFWANGERKHRFRVVVGNTTRKRKPGEGMTMVNATPRMWASVDRVIYNPYWNIPERILKQEILNDDARALPDEEREEWLRGKGYEVKSAGTKWAWVRQPPGPGNALGQVKIIFPNPHDVYLHDTPSKALFKRPRRAFSHGCMRVHKPLDLARVLLEHDDQYNHSSIQRILTRRENHIVPLKDKIAVHVEYITVRVDDQGLPHFLNDVYQMDRAALATLAKAP